MEPAGDATMVAGINSANPTACTSLPMLGCDTPLNDVSALDAIPSTMKDGLTVADLCPCGTCGNFFFVTFKFKFLAHLFYRMYPQFFVVFFYFLQRMVLVSFFNKKLSQCPLKFILTSFVF